MVRAAPPPSRDAKAPKPRPSDLGAVHSDHCAADVHGSATAATVVARRRGSRRKCLSSGLCQ